MINTNTLAPWYPYPELEIFDVSLSLNKSLNSTSNTSIYDGVVHGSVVFWGAQTTTDIYFTNNKLVSMLINFTYLNEHIAADAFAAL